MEYTRQVKREGKVPLSTKFYQGIGAIPDTYKNFAFGTFLLFYYNQVLGMSASLASVAIMVALIVDAITDPLVGSLSDNLKSRWGRRHPLMYLAALPLGFTLYLTFIPPDGLSETGLFIWLTIFSVAVRASMTLFLVPWNALFAEFSEDYVERSQILTFRYLVGWISGVTFTFLTWTYIFPSSEEYTPGHLNPASYETFAIILALLVTVAVLLTTALTQREVPYMLQPKIDPPKFSIWRVLNEVILALRNRNFLIIFIVILTSSIIGGVEGVFGIYMQTYFWGFQPEDLRWFSFAILGAFISFVFINTLQQHFDKQNILIVCALFNLVNGLIIIGLRFLDVLPDNGDPLLLYILIANTVIRVASDTTIGIMAGSMIADTLDAQELETGQRQEGIFSAALSFSGKATSGFGVLIGGLVLDFVLAFPKNVSPTEISESLVFQLGLVAGILIPLFFIIPIYFISWYKITRKDHERIREQLAVKR
ncbi:MAG: MFS transporter [Pseudomonadota bacterium]